MHEAKTRLSELVEKVERRKELVIICRGGKPVAELRPVSVQREKGLAPNRALAIKFAPGFDPAEPASEEEWPEEAR